MAGIPVVTRVYRLHTPLLFTSSFLPFCLLDHLPGGLPFREGNAGLIGPALSPDVIDMRAAVYLTDP